MAKTHITKLTINPDSRYTPITNVLASDMPEGVVRNPDNQEILTWKREKEWAKYTYLKDTKKRLTEEYSTGLWTVYTYDENGKEISREDEQGWISKVPLTEIADAKLRSLFSYEMYYNGRDRLFFKIAPGIMYCPKTDYYDCRGCLGVKKDVIKKMPYTSRFLETFDPKEIISLYRKEKETK